MLQTVVAFVVVLGVLIFVHELGHFLAAKAVGIGTPRFSIGLGPITPIRFRMWDTEFVVSWIPFGGYVKMASRMELEAVEALEGGEAEDYPADQLFENKSLGARILVISAGVIMNALFAWVAYTYVAAVYGKAENPIVTVEEVDAERLPEGAREMARVPPMTDIVRINGDTMASLNDIVARIADPSSPGLFVEFADPVEPVEIPIGGLDQEAREQLLQAITFAQPAYVGTVVPGSPASRAGFEPRDRIVAIGGDSIATFRQLTRIVSAAPGEELEVVVRRDSGLASLAVVPEPEVIRDSVSGTDQTVGRIGITSWVPTRRVQYGLLAAAREGLDQTVRGGSLVILGIKGMLTGQISPRELGGPILIGQVSGQLIQVGVDALISFMAFFSINLAILNLLPIPVLDGGHLVFLFIEGIRGRPLSEVWRMRLSQVGLTLLLGLMLFALTNDVLRLFG